jgi:hypothetical protein
VHVLGDGQDFRASEGASGVSGEVGDVIVEFGGKAAACVEDAAADGQDAIL